MLLGCQAATCSESFLYNILCADNPEAGEKQVQSMLSSSTSAPKQDSEAKDRYQGSRYLDYARAAFFKCDLSHTRNQSLFEDCNDGLFNVLHHSLEINIVKVPSFHTR